MAGSMARCFGSYRASRVTAGAADFLRISEIDVEYHLTVGDTRQGDGVVGLFGLDQGREPARAFAVACSGVGARGRPLPMTPNAPIGLARKHSHSVTQPPPERGRPRRIAGHAGTANADVGPRRAPATQLSRRGCEVLTGTFGRSRVSGAMGGGGLPEALEGVARTAGGGLPGWVIAGVASGVEAFGRATRPCPRSPSKTRHGSRKCVSRQCRLSSKGHQRRGRAQSLR